MDTKTFDCLVLQYELFVLLKIKKEGKLSILLVEQYLDFCLGVGDSFYIMDRGVVVAEGPIAHLTDEVVKKHLTV